MADAEDRTPTTTLRSARSATMTKAPRTAFVFQGGGSLAAPQVGMLRALTEAGLVADLVVGSSAGAMNAVVYASDPNVAGIDRLESLWQSLHRADVAPVSWRVLVAALTGRSDGLVSHVGLRTVLERASLPAAMDQLRLPAHVVATDYESGTAVTLSDGDTVTALLASAAFPGIYPAVDRPTRTGIRKLIDGGVAADVPVLQAASLGADVLYVLPAAVSAERNPRRRSPMFAAYRALGQVLDGTAQRDIDAMKTAVRVLPAPTSNVSNPVDFSGTSVLIDQGYRLAQQWLTNPLRNDTAVDERLTHVS